MYPNRIWDWICLGKTIVMDGLIVVLSLLCLLFAYCALTYRKREKKLEKDILRMLEDAADGSIHEKKFDETSISAVEHTT